MPDRNSISGDEPATVAGTGKAVSLPRAAGFAAGGLLAACGLLEFAVGFPESDGVIATSFSDCRPSAGDAKTSDFGCGQRLALGALRLRGLQRRMPQQA